MIFTRRRFLSAGVAASLSPCVGSSESAESDAGRLPSLKDVALSRGLHFGSDNDGDFYLQPAAYGSLFRRQCELLAPSWSWSRSHPQTPSDLAWEDPSIAFARTNGLRLTGGHLLWYLRSPPWLETLSAAKAEQAILDHIQFLGERYGSITYSWNVVNEALASNGKDDFRPSVYSNKFDFAYYEFAAHKAKEVAPRVLRVYNDYGTDYKTDAAEQKRLRLLRLLDEFRRRNIPIEAVGLQSHLRIASSAYAFDEDVYSGFLREISDRGFKILISELDVFDLATPNSSIESRDRLVAELYRRFLNVALENLAVTTVVVWGLSDRYTWLTPKYDASYKRFDGSPSRPLLFDADFRVKPAFTAVYDALKSAPKRSLS